MGAWFGGGSGPEVSRWWAGSGPLPAHFLLGRPYFGSLTVHFGPLLCHPPCLHVPEPRSHPTAFTDIHICPFLVPPHTPDGFRMVKKPVDNTG